MTELPAKINLEELYGKCLYQVQYVDHQPHEWTAPVTLLKKRAEQFLQDKSIRKVKLLINSITIELDVV